MNIIQSCTPSCTIGTIRLGSTAAYSSSAIKLVTSFQEKMVCCFACLVVLVLTITFGAENSKGDECHISPVIHILQYPGCIPKTIPSFACQGKCTSYVQVSSYKLWQTERSCMCCQEMGVREANVNLYCPKAGPGEPKLRKLVTRAPVDCMCRPCTALDDHLSESGSIVREPTYDDIASKY